MAPVGVGDVSAARGLLPLSRVSHRKTCGKGVQALAKTVSARLGQA